MLLSDVTDQDVDTKKQLFENIYGVQFNANNNLNYIADKITDLNSIYDRIRDSAHVFSYNGKFRNMYHVKKKYIRSLKSN